MLNTRELEKRWLKYKIKTYVPYAIIVTSLIIIAIIVSIFTTSTKEKATLQVTKITLKHQPEKAVKQATQNVRNVQKEQNISIAKENKEPLKQIVETKMTLKPSMNFMRRIESEDQQPYYNMTPPVNKSIKKRKQVIQQATIEENYMDVKEQTKPKRKIEKKPAVKPYKKQIITIERRDSEKDIKEIIARFKKNNNPALSLFVAKKYYEIGNYEQAYNYALITNSINNDIEESWLIFAKSLVKLNKKEMAIKTLKEYIKYSHSGNARILLNDIESGKFK